MNGRAVPELRTDWLTAAPSFSPSIARTARRVRRQTSSAALHRRRQPPAPSVPATNPRRRRRSTREADEAGDWRVRVVPNMYPAVTTCPTPTSRARNDRGRHARFAAVWRTRGHHRVGTSRRSPVGLSARRVREVLRRLSRTARPLARRWQLRRTAWCSRTKARGPAHPRPLAQPTHRVAVVAANGRRRI